MSLHVSSQDSLQPIPTPRTDKSISACNDYHKELKTILYVDDEECLLEIGKLYIERSGLYQVITCNNPFEALALIQNNSYAAVVSDYEMPGMNGIELLTCVRRSGNQIPFIIFTGRGREEIVIAALNEGADFYMQKGGENRSLFIELIHKISVAIERRETRTLLLESNNRLSNILAALPYATFAIDLDHQVIAWNRMMEELTGVYESEMIGRGDFYYSLLLHGASEPGLIDLILGFFPGAHEKYSEFRQDGKVITGEGCLHLASGTRYARIRAAPLYSSDNQIIGAIATIRDISDNFVNESNNKFFFQLYKQIADVSPHWEYWESPLGDLMYCSPSALNVTGYPSQEFLTDPSLITRIIHIEDLSRYHSWVKYHDEKKKEIQRLEYRIISRNGEVRWIEQYATPISHQNNKYIGRIISNQDITKRKRLEEVLEMMNGELEKERSKNKIYKDLLLEKNSLLLRSIHSKKVSRHANKILINHLSEAAVVFINNRIVEYNTHYLELFGYTKEEVADISLHNFIPEKFHDSGELNYQIHPFFTAPQKEHSIYFSCDYRRKDGASFPAQVTMKRQMRDGINTLIFIIKRDSI